MTYAYINSVLDAYPELVALNLNATVYPIAVGPVPDGQQDLKYRVMIAAMPQDAVPGLCSGQNRDGDVIVNFFC